MRGGDSVCDCRLLLCLVWRIIITFTALLVIQTDGAVCLFDSRNNIANCDEFCRKQWKKLILSDIITAYE